MLMPTLVNGVVLGLMYGVMAVALLLLFQTTGVLNFAQADVGMFAVFVTYWMLGATDIPVWWGIGAGLLIAAAMGYAMYLLLVRLRPTDSFQLSLRTLGLFLLLVALAERLWGAAAPYTFPNPFPSHMLRLAGFNVSFAQLAGVAVAVVIVAGIGIVFRYTSIGLLMRAVRSDREIATELGASVHSIDAVAWIASTIVALIVAILVAVTTFLTPTMMGPYLLAAFAAAILGGLHSMVGALIAGLFLGIVQSLGSVYMNQPTWSQIIAFAILLTGMILRERTTLQGAVRV